MAVLNFYEIIKKGLHFNKFEIEQTICVEYNCPLENEQAWICSQSDYILHVLSGRKTWRTIDGEWVMKAGDTLYVKKGVTVVHQFFEDEFCMLGFFVSDDLIRESVKEIMPGVPSDTDKEELQFTAAELSSNQYLEGFFQSMLTYFRGEQQPEEYILKLKLKELVANICCGGENAGLISYLKSVAKQSRPSLARIMESSYCCNLSLSEFAKLCHRSLSSFKRDFQVHYNTTPGKWLISKRLDHAAGLLFNHNSNIAEVAFDSGFEDASHFSRAFRQKFGIPPSQYRKVTA